MLFDPTVFKVLWIGTACLILVVGLTLAALAVVHLMAVIRMLRKAEPRQWPYVLAALLRQGRHNLRKDSFATPSQADSMLSGEPPPNFPL